ncbi:MAG: ATP-binding cassette domain-containing protein, partial [Albidovulum sp.]|nr:ATP-binding cassette domain-containing protein [Albidovulum sp.]
VLTRVSFAIERGEVLGIVGGSGSGKTTLGRTLLRLIEPQAGHLFFDGIEIGRLPDISLRPFRRRLQMIFQDPMSSLNPRRMVYGIIAGPLRLHGYPDIQDRVEKAMTQVGLSYRLRHRFPHELSGGQRQRVGIARAIALDPEFIVADEIVSGLDVLTQAQVINLLEGLVADLGLTLAFISHDLSVVRRLCARVLVLSKGEVAELAPTSEIFECPKHPVTRGLLDAIPLPDPEQKNWKAF